MTFKTSRSEVVRGRPPRLGAGSKGSIKANSASRRLRSAHPYDLEVMVRPQRWLLRSGWEFLVAGRLAKRIMGEICAGLATLR